MWRSIRAVSELYDRRRDLGHPLSSSALHGSGPANAPHRFVNGDFAYLLIAWGYFASKAGVISGF